MRGVKVRRLNHGEVSDPDQDQGERSLAYDQPLLPGCDGACAVSGTQAVGESSGGPSSLPCTT